MRTNVYVDGFNLYYGAAKNTPYRWLDLGRLCQLLLPKNEIRRIRYFTALVEARPDDPTKQQRQLTFIRALRTIPNLTVHYGTFLSRPARMALANASPGGPRTVEVLETKEKGSDVNLATYLIFDGFAGEYEVAAVISNDSDLVEPIRMVRQRLGLRVGVINPHKNTSHALVKVATFYKPIREGVLRASLFPAVMEDAHGRFHKPAGW